MPEHAQKYPLDARKIDARPFPNLYCYGSSAQPNRAVLEARLAAAPGPLSLLSSVGDQTYCLDKKCYKINQEIIFFYYFEKK